MGESASRPAASGKSNIAVQRRAGGSGVSESRRSSADRSCRPEVTTDPNSGKGLSRLCRDRDSDSENEEDFSAMRRKAKELAARAPTSSLKTSRRIDALGASDAIGVNVHPSVFEYEENAKR